MKKLKSKLFIATFALAESFSLVNISHAQSSKVKTMNHYVNHSHENFFGEEHIFKTNFESSNTGWLHENTEVKSENGNHYAYLNGYVDCPPFGGCHFKLGALQRKISLTPGAKYKISFKAKGVGKIGINGSYVLDVNNGDPSSFLGAKEYTYIFTSVTNEVSFLFLAYGTKMAVDDIVLEVNN
ncbi:hypothetical protein ACPA2L_30480 [Bacillus bombysepticus]